MVLVMRRGKVLGKFDTVGAALTFGEALLFSDWYLLDEDELIRAPK